MNRAIRSSDRLRVVYVGILVILLLSFLIAQFYNIQIVEGERWTREAMRQHFFIIREPFLRGTFYSNTSLKQGSPEIPQKLVVDIQKFHLYIDPQSIPKAFGPSISKNLISLLEIEPSEQKNFASQFKRKSRSRKLAMWLDKETRDQILEWWGPYSKKRRIPRNALYFVSDYQRSYPFGKLLGQVLHTIQAVKDERTGQAIPTGGMELSCNKYLQGKEGKRRLMRSPRNAMETGNLIQEPQHGADIHLTINHCLQAIAEEEIGKGVISCKAKSGWALMMNPRTGEILALAQYPHFYPPDCQNYFNDPQLIEHTRVKAINDANEPGSIMKAITIAVALKANKELKGRGEKPIFNPEEKMATSNSHFAGRKNLTDTHLHNFLNMDMAIQKSSNIYVARLVEKVVSRLGENWYKRALHETFGFGEKTGIELPSESKGLVPTPGKKHPNGTLEWSKPTPYSLAMGHNIQTTALQIARAFSVFANGGYLVKPTLIRKIVRNHEDGSQEILLDHTQQDWKEKFPKVLDEEIVRLVTTSLKYTTKIGGTARRADILGYTECGKTGTAQKNENGTYSNKLYCSTFVGFAPVKDPAFVLVVTMDEPEYGYVEQIGKIHHGGTCAAPVFREIGKRSLEYLGIAPDDPHGYTVGDPRHDPNKADWMAETRKLQEKYEKWNKGSERESR